MPVKHALVVDDSRVASIALRRLLEGYGLTVDTVESAEDSLKFLKQHRPPTAIFMDHMMPGMDGFEALQAIKRDPAIAAVPVVMYTSKEGDAYMGQARTLGAAAVLSKPIKPLQLSKILADLGVAAPSDNRAIVPAPDKPPDDDNLRHIARDAADAMAQSNLPALMRRLFDEQRTALQSDIGAAINAQAAALPPSAARGYGKVASVFALVLLASTGAWAWYINRELTHDREALRAQVARLQTPPAAVEEDGDNATRERQQRGARERVVLLDALVWSLNNNGHYEYDQPPLNDERVHVLRELLARLIQANFKGVVRLETHVAEFCLTRTEQGAWRSPSDDAASARCDVVNYSAEQAVNLGKRQSLAFARFLTTVPATYPGVRVDIVSFGKDRPTAQPPPPHSLQTAGDWNKIARRNNRVEIALISAP